MGILLLIVDIATANSRALADVEYIRPGQKTPGEHERIPSLGTTRNQAALRIVLWPVLAAASGGQ